MASVAEAYDLYLDKARGFENPPVIGPDWPTADNAVLPDLATFMAAVREQAAETVMNELILHEGLARPEKIAAVAQ